MQIRSCRLNPILWNPALQQEYLHSTYVPDDNPQRNRCWLPPPWRSVLPSRFLQLPLAGTIQSSSLLKTVPLGETGVHVLSKLCDDFGKFPKYCLTCNTSQCSWGSITEPGFWRCPVPARRGESMDTPRHPPQHPFPWQKRQLWKCRVACWGRCPLLLTSCHRGEDNWQGELPAGGAVLGWCCVTVCPPAPGTGGDGALRDPLFSH